MSALIPAGVKPAPQGTVEGEGNAASAAGASIASLFLKSLYNPTIGIALFLMAAIVMMILPIPPLLLDIGLTISFTSSILIFMIVLFIERPLDFSSFPTVLLGSLLLRLSLNVSSTKLILGQGHTGTSAAGDVIEGFANFIMGNNLLMGIVVFLVIMIVNFMVITKGAGRMAEVGARFALDAMPGKQLAIDADVSSGAITHEEATRRRRTEQEETTFYGSLDGASKFVKGDAVAGLLITALNFLVGIAMGVVYYDMPIAKAMHTYSILTIGDGLVTQIPSVIISIAAALLMAKGGAHGSADIAVFKQFRAYPVALIAVAALMFAFAAVPGMPVLAFLVAGSVIGFIGWRSYQQKALDDVEKAKQESLKTQDAPVIEEQTLGDHMDVDEIWVEFSKRLVPTIMDTTIGITSRVTAMRRALAGELGFVLPEVRLTDSPMLEGVSYVIRVHGVKVAQAELRMGQVLVIKREGTVLPFAGEDTDEPVYQAPARWIPEDKKDSVLALGLPVATHNEIIATHLMETIKSNMRELVTRQAVQRMMNEFVNVTNKKRAEENKKLLDDVIPDSITRETLHQVIRGLLEERVSVRNLPLILEGLIEAKAIHGANNVPMMIEQVRRKLSLQISTALVDQDGTLPVVQLGSEWEHVFQQYEIKDNQGNILDVAIPPSEINRMIDSVNQQFMIVSQTGRFPCLAVPGPRRRMIFTVLDAKGIRNPVLAFEELHPRVKIALLGIA